MLLSDMKGESMVQTKRVKGLFESTCPQGCCVYLKGVVQWKILVESANFIYPEVILGSFAFQGAWLSLLTSAGTGRLGFRVCTHTIGPLAMLR